jgi:hypothetical protein
MTAHELAHQLLHGEDLPVCLPSSSGDHEVIIGCEEFDEEFFDMDKDQFRKNGPHILLS